MAQKTWSSLNKGAYSAETAYTAGDFISYEGGYYTCIQNTTGNAPTAGDDNDYWKLVASKGDTGDQGIQGIQGIQGETGLTGTSFIWKGAWSGATAYVANDVVSSNGSAYVCILASTNNEPPNETYWSLMAQKGLDGEGAGDVVGPASAVGDNFVAFDSTTGKLIKDSGAKVSDFATAAQGATADTALQPDDLSTHEADTSTHGVTGAVVGTTDTQTLENKTVVSPTITGTPVLNADSAVPFYNSSLSRQTIINGNFVVNQRVYVSDATLAAGSYGHDRWKAGASGGDYTFTQLPSSTQITIKTGKSLIQVVEDKNVIGGTYTLSWEGTAQARFGVDSATPSGSYAASPITITNQTAGTVMSVEFNEGTLGKVSLNSGSVPLPFQPKSYGEELRACQRYCLVNNYVSGDIVGFGNNNVTTQGRILIPTPVPMRITPTSVTVGTIGNYVVRGGGTSNTASAIAITGGATNSGVTLLFTATVATNYAYSVYTSTTEKLTLEAEL